MNEAIPAAEQFEIASCWNHDNRPAAEIGPDGEPLCVGCAVALAKKIVRAAKLRKRQARRGAMAPSLKTRSAR